MVDRKKVIHGLNSCGNDDGHPDRCGRTECPYRDNGAWCTHELAHDAEVLVSEWLKAQEPMMVEERADTDTINCPKCGQQFARVGCDKSIYLDTDEEPNYCPKCGQAVKWE